MKFTNTGNKATIRLTDGIVIMLSECSKDDLEFLLNTDNENAVKERFIPGLKPFEKTQKVADQKNDCDEKKEIAKKKIKWKIKTTNTQKF